MTLPPLIRMACGHLADAMTSDGRPVCTRCPEPEAATPTPPRCFICGRTILGLIPYPGQQRAMHSSCFRRRTRSA